MNYFFLLIILLVLFEFYLRSKKKSDIKYENIKRVPSLNLERSYKIKSNTGHLQNSKKSKILGWDLVENSHINVEISIPYFKEETIDYFLNNVAARSNIKN